MGAKDHPGFKIDVRLVSDSRTCCNVVDARSLMVLNKFDDDDDDDDDDVDNVALTGAAPPTPDVPDKLLTLGDVGA